MDPASLQVFISYAHEDEKLREELEKHLSQLQRSGIITAWHDRLIGPGQEWEGQIDSHLESAQLVLLLISADFMHSDYCHDVEMKRAMARHNNGEARVVPIILRPVDWEGADFGKLQCLPKDGKAVTEWLNQDQAFKNIAEGIRKAAKTIWRQQQKSATIAPPRTRRRRNLLAGSGIVLVLATLVFYGYRWDRRLESHLAAGRAFLNTGRYAEAGQPYRQASRLCPFCPEASLGLAIVNLHDPAQAQAYEDHLKSLQATAPDDSQVQIAAGNLAVYQGETQDAIEHYRQAIASNPNIAEAHYRLGIVYQQEGRRPEALTHYQQALNLADPAPLLYLGQLASLYIKLKDYDQAEKIYRKIDSRFLLGHQELALLRRLQGRLPEARDQQDQLVRLLDNPTVTGLPMNQEPWAFETDRVRIEFHLLERKKAYAYYSLATTLYLLGQEDAAREYREKAQALGDKQEEVKEVVSYDLRRLADEQPRWRERSAEFQQRFLAPAAGS
ncbi:MAG: tetratricopeptide repeat protein [Candidatus Competibacteraceae bacterium]